MEHSRESLQELAFWFLQNKNIEKAILYFAKHIERSLSDGNPSRDEAFFESIDQLKRLSERGEKEATYFLAGVFLTEQWFRLALDQGHPRAAFSLLQFYCAKMGREKQRESQELFEQLKEDNEEVVMSWLQAHKGQYPLARQLLGEKQACCLIS